MTCPRTWNVLGRIGEVIRALSYQPFYFHHARLQDMACATRYNMRFEALCNECAARDDYEDVLCCLPILSPSSSDSFLYSMQALADARKCPQVPTWASLNVGGYCLCLRSCCAYLTRNHTYIEVKLALPLASVCTKAICGCPCRGMVMTGLQTPSRHCPLHSTLSKIFSCKRLSPRMPQRSCRIQAIDERQLLGEVDSRLLGQCTHIAGGNPRELNLLKTFSGMQ